MIEMFHQMTYPKELCCRVKDMHSLSTARLINKTYGLSMHFVNLIPSKVNNRRREDGNRFVTPQLRVSLVHEQRMFLFSVHTLKKVCVRLKRRHFACVSV